MFRILTVSMFAFTVVALIGQPVAQAKVDKSRKFIVITDMEPDDRLALQFLTANIEPEQLLLVGTTVMDSGRKAVLVRKLLNQVGFNSVPVAVGTGGEKKSLPRNC